MLICGRSSKFTGPLSLVTFLQPKRMDVTNSGTSAVGDHFPIKPLEAMDPQLTTIQPGGGIIIHLEIAWGYVRRAYLKLFRKDFVAEMAQKRKGFTNPCPHEVLDPRDVKYYENQPGYYWDEKDDPFAYRDRLPFVREGLAELFVFSVLTFVPATICGWKWLNSPNEGAREWILLSSALALTIVGGLIVWFFRNPWREIPEFEGAVVSPADGEIVSIQHLPHDEYIGGPAVLIGIFLSIFNVHANRSPRAARVVGLRYKPGKYLNALDPLSALENERLTILLQETSAPYRPLIVRQIAGLIARRIVCRVRPGDQLEAGERFGMIKLGSRTEIVIPQHDKLQIMVQTGDLVLGGATLLATYPSKTQAPRSV